MGCSMRWLTRHAGSHGSRSSCRQANATAPLSAVCLTDAGRFVRCVRCSRRPVAVSGLLDAIYFGGAVEGPLALRSGRGVLAASVCLLAVRSSSCQCERNRWGLGSTSINVSLSRPAWAIFGFRTDARLVILRSTIRRQRSLPRADTGGIMATFQNTVTIRRAIDDVPSPTGARKALR